MVIGLWYDPLILDYVGWTYHFPLPFESFSSISLLFPGVCIPDFDCLIYGLDVGDVGVEVVRVVPIQATRVG